MKNVLWCLCLLVSSAAHAQTADGTSVWLEEGELWATFEGETRKLALPCAPTDALLVPSGHSAVAVCDNKLTQRGAPLEGSAVWWVPLDAGGEPGVLFATGFGEGVAPHFELGSVSPGTEHISAWYDFGGGHRSRGAPLVILSNFGMREILPVGDSVPRRSFQSWSPDGSKLAVTLGSGHSRIHRRHLAVVDVGAGEVRALTSEETMATGHVAWSPDGAWIAFAGVEVVDGGGGSEDDPTETVDPDNRHGGGWRVWLADAQSGEIRAIGDGSRYQDAPVWSADGEALYFVERSGKGKRIKTFLAVHHLTSGETAKVAGSELADAAGDPSSWLDVLTHVPQ